MTLFVALLFVAALVATVKVLSEAHVFEVERPLARGIVGFGAAFFAMVTFLMFIPAGAVLAVFAIAGGGAVTIFGLGLLYTCVSGAHFAARALEAPKALYADDRLFLRELGLRAIVHHALVAGVFVTGWFAFRFELAFVLYPCLIGVFLGIALARFGLIHERIPRAAIV